MLTRPQLADLRESAAKLQQFPDAWRSDTVRVLRRLGMPGLADAAVEAATSPDLSAWCADFAGTLSRLGRQYEAPASTALTDMAGAWNAYLQARTWDGEDMFGAPAQAIMACWMLRVEALRASQAA